MPCPVTATLTTLNYSKLTLQYLMVHSPIISVYPSVSTVRKHNMHLVRTLVVAHQTVVLLVYVLQTHRKFIQYPQNHQPADHISCQGYYSTVGQLRRRGGTDLLRITTTYITIHQAVTFKAFISSLQYYVFICLSLCFLIITEVRYATWELMVALHQYYACIESVIFYH